MATCPECDAELEIDDDDLDEMEVGDPWDCEACGSRLRVGVLDPLEFDSDEDEDDEDDDRDDDEDEESDDVDEDSDDEGEGDSGGDWDE
jgi:alpha-aminoadipate carrier protein LysW